MASSVMPDIENLSILFNKQADLKITTTEDQTQIDNSIVNIQSRRPLNVSTLAHYFGLQCDEFLRLSLNAQIESNNTEHLKNFLQKQRGISFENDIKQYHIQSILSNIHDEHEFLTYIQSSIASPTEPRIAYNVKFHWTSDKHLQSNYKPDFLLIKHIVNNDNRIQITIADAKSSFRMRIEHCIQVSLYAIDLQVWIERNRLDEHVFINDIGEIWLPSDNNLIPYEKKTFPMIKLQERLKNFLKYDLEKVLTGSEWIMLPRCSLCSYAPRCRQRAIYFEPESINNLSYLTSSSHSLIYTFFHSTLYSSIDLKQIFIDSHGDDLYSEDRRKLQSILFINAEDKTSAVLKALETHEPQLKQQTSLLIPKKNKDLILLFMLLIPDPSQLHSVALFAYNLYDSLNQSWFFSVPIIQSYPTSYQIVSMISQSLEFDGKFQRPCQIVLFDEQEKTILFEQLTLASDSENINQCLILLSSSENAILLDYPPDVIQTDRFFRTHPLSNVSKDAIEQELYERYGSSGDNDNDKKPTKTELAQQLRRLNEKEQEIARKTLIGLPFLVCLHTAIRQSFVIPMPAYFELNDLKYSFNIALPSSNPNEIFESIKKPEIDNLVQQHLNVCVRLYTIVQNHLSESNRLQLDAYSLPQMTPIVSSHPHIRRLIFLRQYEMLYSLRSIQQTRFDLNEPPIVIRIKDKKQIDQYNNLWQCQVERGQDIISKNLTDNVINPNDFRTYSYFISDDIYTIRTFPDAIYMDLAIDGVRSHTKFDRCGLVHIEQKDIEDESIFIRVKLNNLSLQINHQYYLSERYVDFNTKKAIQALEQATSLTIQILDDPRQLTKPEAIQKTSQTLQQEISNMFTKREPSIKPEGLNILNKSQQLACEKVKNQRVTLIWGPPGTGKTYWSSVTVFQMLMFSSSPLRILITACTHTAIDNLLASINHIKILFSSSPQFSQWYQLSQALVVLKIDSSNYRTLSASYQKCSTIVGSTVWTLQKLDRSIVFDVIFVDEATQVLTSDAALAINRLADHNESRLIVAGDPLQLPPIKRCVYPSLPHPTPDLFSSIFHCLLRDENNIPISLCTEKPFEQISMCPYLSTFDENHRMNDQLSDFTRLLYGETYRQSRSTPLLSIQSANNLHTNLLGPLLQPNSSLYTLLIDSSACLFSTRSEDLNLESHLVYSLINELVSRISVSSIFIITPHRMQRSAIRQKLVKNPFSNVSITYDTVERMQGKEAQCVILCMLYRQRELLESELDFIYNRQRINVSITRAKQICILLTSQLLINHPPFELFANENTRNAYTLLSNFIDKSTIRLLDTNGNIK
ncbi:unnamed protein product [Rotaria magnacalcarata]|uniref:Helicase ATP-binding domain-containing protein n=1 Tax=Rotaria magnacalcarata TaxID=392030 RepID=A0A819GIE5_9BILA|nr:unnamed protein product [Rotaria magnacalcarata]CAF3880324.1 unnamed protein product [Rotaria magnacalcarata]